MVGRIIDSYSLIILEIKISGRRDAITSVLEIKEAKRVASEAARKQQEGATDAPINTRSDGTTFIRDRLVEEETGGISLNQHGIMSLAGQPNSLEVPQLHDPSFGNETLRDIGGGLLGSVWDMGGGSESWNAQYPLGIGLDENALAGFYQDMDDLSQFFQPLSDSNTSLPALNPFSADIASTSISLSLSMKSLILFLSAAFDPSDPFPRGNVS